MAIIMQWILVLVVLLAGGCSSHGKQEEAHVARVNIGREPESLDPHKVQDLSSQMVVRMLFEGLTRIGQDLKPQLALAKSVTISPDQKEYIFSLRDAFWTNGKEVTASDFVYAYRRILHPKFPSSTAFQLYVIKNAKLAREGRVSLSEIGVEALDEKTVKISLENPTAYFLELLALPCFFPLPYGVDDVSPKWAEDPSAYVSNGPFTLSQWKHEDLLFLSKNPSYWEESKVQLQGLKCMMVSEETEVQMFEKKELDFAGSPFSKLPIDALSAFRQQGILRSQEMLGTAFLRVNVASKCLKNAKVRQALSSAIGREALTTHVTQGGQLPAFSLVPPSFSLHKEKQREGSAQELFFEGLKELKMKEAPSLRLVYRSDDRNRALAQALQEQWRSTLSIQVELEGIEGNVYYSRVAKLDYDLALGSWIADINDPMNFLEIFKFKNGGSNNTGWENAEYAALLTEASQSVDGEERNALLGQAEEILARELPAIPLYHTTQLYLMQEEMRNVVISSLGSIDFKWVEKRGNP